MPERECESLKFPIVYTVSFSGRGVDLGNRLGQFGFPRAGQTGEEHNAGRLGGILGPPFDQLHLSRAHGVDRRTWPINPSGPAHPRNRRSSPEPGGVCSSATPVFCAIGFDDVLGRQAKRCDWSCGGRSATATYLRGSWVRVGLIADQLTAFLQRLDCLRWQPLAHDKSRGRGSLPAASPHLRY